MLVYILIANALLRRLWLDEHQSFQEIPDTAERRLLSLEFLRRFSVFRRIFVRVSNVRVLRKPPRDLFGESIRLLRAVLLSQLELETNRESVGIECGNSQLDGCAKVFPGRSITRGNRCRADASGRRELIPKFLLVVQCIAPRLQGVR